MQETAEIEAKGAMTGNAQGTPVDPNSGLATDYLNHFNEVVMILEMLPTAPELFEEIAGWQPISYRQHFSKSGFSDWQRVVDAYESAPEIYRAPFDQAVEALSGLLADSIGDMAELAAAEDFAGIEQIAAMAHAEALPLIAEITGLIQGRLPQPADESGQEGNISQAEIDALFD